MADCITSLARPIVQFLQEYIISLGFTPVIHFELEGCYQSRNNRQADFQKINQQLQQLNIEGQLVSEYWAQQWEYVSLFNGQLPLAEADYLSQAMLHLPRLFQQQGIEQTLIKPVVWAGDRGKLAQGCQNIFSGDSRSVHIPNAIQMNVSVTNQRQENIIVQEWFGEYLQQCFIETSLGCSLLYLPEEEAFDRFALKTKYGLAQELCSPDDISGGHKGSIALYKQYGKHDQSLGEKPLVYDQYHNVIASEHLWHKTARIEHRLGASSRAYNAYVNVIYALLNVIDALTCFIEGTCQQKLKQRIAVQALPGSLQDQGERPGAISLFKQDSWFAQRINELAVQAPENNTPAPGCALKQAILSSHQSENIIIKQ